MLSWVPTVNIQLCFVARRLVLSLLISDSWKAELQAPTFMDKAGVNTGEYTGYSPSSGLTGYSPTLWAIVAYTGYSPSLCVPCRIQIQADKGTTPHTWVRHTLKHYRRRRGPTWTMTAPCLQLLGPNWLNLSFGLGVGSFYSTHLLTSSPMKFGLLIVLSQLHLVTSEELGAVVIGPIPIYTHSSNGPCSKELTT